ncbi:unnamed protein product [Symbiodinium natans]|uniref:Methyltransferase domain-containing protein n=1 Tax=Symbiodinium natans TaxID=878477 RepID=A0A812HXE0_9DINO|nr:unnamed protein product [Symbiodinium natans]
MPLWEDSGELASKRPERVRRGIAAKFAEQENAGRDKKYGAVGSLDYELSGFVWDCAENVTTRERIFGLSDLVETLSPVGKRENFTVLDLGCGDGQSLFALHSHFGLSWENIVGVTAEDSRGLEVLAGTEPFDLRSAGGADSDASYIIWNIDDLTSCPALQGRTFDLIISWVTWIWLADPVGTLEMIYEHFLNSGGVMMLGGMQLLTLGPDPLEDQRWLFALSDFLREEGHQIKCFADASTGAYTWWIQRKRSRLALSRLVSYCESTSVHEPSHKALYDVNADILGGLACGYAGAGGMYPLPPPAACDAIEVPSTRICDNRDRLSDAELARHASNLKIHVSRMELDIRSCIQAWFKADMHP